jgi:RsiW-degrading membrane proteinase PrsW (M82 family)
MSTNIPTTNSPSTNIVRLALPLRFWFRSPILRRRSSLFFAGLVGYPLAVGWLIEHQFRPVSISADGTAGPGAQADLIHDLKWLDWPFVGYFGLAWLIGMWLLVRPKVRPLPIATVALTALITGTPIAIWLETRLPSNPGNLIQSIVGVGGSEEFAKIVPLLAALALVPRFFPRRASELFELSPKTWLYLGAVSGVVFGCAEGVEYIVGSQNLSIHGQGGAIDLSFMIFERLITDPLNHMLWAGVTGYFIGLAVQRARLAGRPTIGGVVLGHGWLIAVGLIIASALHGVNDFVATNSLAQSLVDVISALLLLGYALAGDVVEQAVIAASPRKWGARLGQASRRVSPPQVPYAPPTNPMMPFPQPVPFTQPVQFTPPAPYPPGPYARSTNGY